MADEITNGDNVLVEFAENNVLLVDPNKVFEKGRPQDRLVNHENLSIYANLQARVVPRSKLISGAGVENETPQSFVDVFEGEINFLKPSGKDYFTTDWTDTQTGKGFRTPNGPLNQKSFINTIDANGNSLLREKITNKTDNESFGIENISVTINKAFTPIVNITFVDVRGQTLFEQGANSPYAAFFQLPYPLFKLTLKGYYGKAVQYQLMMEKFNASFDGGSGNYTVTCSFKGRVVALLADLTLQELRIAPYMFTRQYTVSDRQNNNKEQKFITSKGRETLTNVYENYKSLGLVTPSLPDITIDELVSKVTNLEDELQKALSSYNLQQLDHIEEYDRVSDRYRKSILANGGWRATYCNTDITSPQGPVTDSKGITYYRLKETYRDGGQKEKDAVKRLEDIITNFNKQLNQNTTFGSIGPKKIPVNITVQDINISPALPLSLINEGKVDPKNTDKWFVFSGGPNLFEEKIGKIISSFDTKRNIIEKNLTDIVNGLVIDILGFKPSVRNIFAILIAHADTFLRLMDETHRDSFSVRNDPRRLNAVKGPGQASTNTELPEDNFIYPWPHYFITKEENGATSYVSTYPGAIGALSQTKAFDALLWPEVSFVEEFFKGQALIKGDSKPDFFTDNVGEPWLPVTSFFIDEQTVYTNKSKVPFLYEMWDRSTIFTNFSGLATRLEFKNARTTYKSFGNLESANLTDILVGDFSLSEQLKNQNYTATSFREFLQAISPLNNYQLLVRDEYSTEYIRTKINDNRFAIMSKVKFNGLNYQLNEINVDDSVGFLKEALIQPAIPNIIETYPFSHFDGNPNNSWVSNNLAGGQSIASYENLNHIADGVVYLPNQQTYSSDIPNQTLSGIIPNIQFYTDGNWSYRTLTQLINVKLLREGNLQNQALSWKTYFENITNTYPKNSNFLLTEGEINYGDNYSGNTYNKQITSLLNTPYFTNAFVQGIKNQITLDTNNIGDEHVYKAAAYLFLNSLPLPTLREKSLKVEQDYVNVYGDYLGKILNQVSAVHSLPYAWILKYGSIWHRYKENIENGTDFLSSVWENFDSAEYFNNSNGTNHIYNLNIGISATTSGTTIVPIDFAAQYNNGQNQNTINLGFYPELNNYIYYFITGEELLYNSLNITGADISSSEINLKIDNKDLFINQLESLSFSSPSGETTCNFWYSYLDINRSSFSSGYTETEYLLFPSCGGLEYQQLEFEEQNINNLINNPIGPNGSTRFMWGAAGYGFFEHNTNTLPNPNQYLKVIDPNIDEQTVFTITDSSNYASIEELFDVFTPDILDVFERYFLDFTKKDTQDDIYNTTATTSTILGNVETTFQSLFREMMKVKKSQLDESMMSNVKYLNYDLYTAQLNNISQIMKNFLGGQLSFNFYNPKDVNIKSFKSFLQLDGADYYDFGNYSGNLPPNLTLLDSQTSFPDEWKTLQLEVGFYSPVLSGQTTDLIYGDLGNYVTDFFIENNIAFTSSNIKLLRKVIRMYVTERIVSGPNQPVDVTEFKGKIFNQIIDNYSNLKSEYLTQLFLRLKKDLPTTVSGEVEEFQNQSAYQSDENKLEQYMVFKTLNDKWISGEDFGSKFIFKDFLFLDVANRDIGDLAILDTDAIKNFTNPQNANASLLTIIGTLLQGNYFNFYGMPSYINFYGIASNTNTPIPKFSTQDEANALFGTHLEVDFLDSSPKFVCQYVGPPSTQLSDLGPQSRFNNDSFMLGRTSENPLFSNCNDPARCNKVMSFAVDFAIQSQGMFKGISLDQSQFKNTSESFVVTEMMAQSANDNSIMTQGLSLFNIYKSRSYTCKVTSLGNVCIQPTMYFTLRNVPMFNGPYLILDVEHTIQPNTMTTTFTGVRVPFHKLPDIQNVVAKLNKKLISRVKKKQETEVKVAEEGGFNVEGRAEYENVKNNKIYFPGRSKTRKYVVIHVTGGINYGSDPVGNINSQHLNRGWAGIGYHYLISRGAAGGDNEPDGTLYGARPENKDGAHVQGHNQESISVSMIADCQKIGSYDSSGTYATTAQKNTLEWTVLYLLFGTQIFELEPNLTFSQQNYDDIPAHENMRLRINPIDVTVNDPKVTNNKEKGVTVSMWKQVVKGHNDFSNKRCPCFRSQEALSGTLGNNLRKKLAQIFEEIENSNIKGISNMNQAILNNVLRNKGFKVVPSPYSTDDLASGLSNPPVTSSNTQIITPPNDDIVGDPGPVGNDYA